ncbi:MAG: NAD-dependent succinate-semialdehyde dehydrogenase [Candidatus Solibacter sp.]
MIATVNPATGEILARFDALSEAELDEKLARATEVFRFWRYTTFAERAACMSRIVDILEADADDFARLMTLEMGKPLAAARAEALKCATACRYYIEHAERLLADEPVDTGAAHSFIRYQAIGPVLAVMPWNFPFWQVFRFLAPALMAGNVGLLKHASNVPQCAMAIEEIVRRAGFPDGVFQTLLIGAGMVQRVIDSPHVMAVTLTGSEPAGKQVASQAGRRIKKCVLELGGSDPFIVMPTADLAAAVRTAVQARVINNGQSCIAAKRFIVDQSIADEFEARFVHDMAALVVGDPMLEATQVGPLATPVILNDLDDQVRRSVAAGARVLTGGHRVERPGNYYAPTVLTDVPEDSPAYREELFGPVAVILRVDGIDEAIRVANDTPFGLGASAWTKDPAQQEHFIAELEAGMVFINGMVASDARLPFGGIKASGFGRELSDWGIREFVNVKSVVVA